MVMLFAVVVKPPVIVQHFGWLHKYPLLFTKYSRSIRCGGIGIASVPYSV